MRRGDDPVPGAGAADPDRGDGPVPGNGVGDPESRGPGGGGERLLTVPNVIAGARLAGIGPLLWAAHGGHRPAFLWIMVALLLSDWVDGKLAILLDQATELGARLDSAADGLMYAALGLAFWWLEPALIVEHLAWITAVVVSWSLSAGVALARFGRLPSYHTRAAKTSWLLGALAAVALVPTDLTWPFPVALAAVTLTNLEAVAIGLVLREWRANVPSIFHAARERRSDR